LPRLATPASGLRRRTGSAQGVVVGASLFQPFVNEIAMSNVSGPNSAKSSKQVESQKRWMAHALQLIDDIDLPGNIPIAQRNMALRFYQVLMNEPQVHSESIRQQRRLAY